MPATIDRPQPEEDARSHVANIGQIAITMREDAEALAQIGARVLAVYHALDERTRAALMQLERDATQPAEG
jgi:hypothetical protein